MREYIERIKEKNEKNEECLEKGRKRKQAARLKQQSGIRSEVKVHRNKPNRERV